MSNSTPRDAHVSGVDFDGTGQNRSETASTSSLNPYAFIREWWGEELSDELILRLEGAPGKHLLAFLNDWETLSEASRDLFKSDLVLPPLGIGTLRPLVRGYGLQTVPFALSMILYCHEVVLENPLGDFSDTIRTKSGLRRVRHEERSNDSSDFTLGIPEKRSRDKEGVVGAFRDLLILQPLVNAGIIHLRCMPYWVDGGKFFEWILSDDDQAAKILFESAGSSVGFEWIAGSSDDSTHQDPFESAEPLKADRRAYAKTAGLGFRTGPGGTGYLDMAWSFMLYTRSEGCGQLMIKDPAAAEKVRNALSRIGNVDHDLRGITMSKLGALSVPVLQRRIPDLISIRASEEVFADWRRSLSFALAQVADIQSGDTQDWSRQASSIVHAELEPFRQEFQDIATASPALRALQSGFASLGIEAIGAATGAAVGGRASSAFAGLVAGKAAHTLVSYLKALKERRSARAVLDIAFMFDPGKS